MKVSSYSFLFDLKICLTMRFSASLKICFSFSVMRCSLSTGLKRLNGLKSSAFSRSRRIFPRALSSKLIIESRLSRIALWAAFTDAVGSWRDMATWKKLHFSHAQAVVIRFRNELFCLGADSLAVSDGSPKNLVPVDGNVDWDLCDTNVACQPFWNIAYKQKPINVRAACPCQRMNVTAPHKLTNPVEHTQKVL